MKVSFNSSCKGWWNVAFFSALTLVSVAISFDSAGQVTAQELELPTAEIQAGDAEGDGAAEQVNNPWIGVAVGPVSDGIRAHIEIPGNSGLIVRDVAPDGPADKAGLKEYDILIRADKNPLATPADLVEIVSTWDGSTDGIKFEWIRKGVELSDIITPGERPDNLGGPQIPAQIAQLQKQLNGGQQQRFQFFGPGIQTTNKSVQSINENGLKIKIERNNDEPAEISVDNGESTWELTENDLSELPEDLEARVKKMLNTPAGATIKIQQFGGGQMPNFQIPPVQIPKIDIPEIEAMRKEFKELGFPQIEDRFDEMEKQMQKMLEEIERLQPAQPAPAADDDAIDLGNDA